MFVRLDGERVHQRLQLDLFLLEVVVQRAHDFRDHGVEARGGAADFARTGVIDELVQLRGDAVGLVNDVAGPGAHLRRGVLAAGNHLGHAADDVQRVARFVGEAGGGEVHFLEMGIQLAGADEADLQFGSLSQIAPGQPVTRHANGRQDADKNSESRHHA